MNLKRCSNGHFYDADKYKTCPHCKSPIPGVTEKLDSADQNEENSVLKQAVSDVTTTVDIDDQKTMGFFSFGADSSEPVAAWLVCVKGNHYGEDFRLTVGRNFIGRSSTMDVCLSGDTSVSRDKHLIIVFEPKQNKFLVQPGESKELSYLNNDVILQPVELKAYDHLLVGKSEFIFVPFCTEDVNWSKFKNEE